MTRNQKILGSILGTACVLASATAISSQQPAVDTTVLERESWIQEPRTAPPTPRPGDDTFSFISGEMSFDGKVVKRAPYSAQAVTEIIQTLSDGNRIVNKSTTSIYRDSEGRTRREQTLRAIGPFRTEGEQPQMIYINDPVAQMSYTLDARTHVARKMPSYRFSVNVITPQAEGTRPPTATEGATPAPSGRYEGNSDVYVRTTPPAPGGEGYRVEYYGGGKRAKAESLGKKMIEGVEAEGTRTTVTIPAGEIGNDLAIEIVNERWYSPELQTVVMSRQNDPRFGETIYRLMNIDRIEPSKSLFEVPADYTIKGAGQGGPAVESGYAPPAASSTSPRTLSGGVLNGKATSLPLPEMPAVARAANASGTVTVEVLIDEGGNVVAAKAVAGHPLLQAAAVTAARQAKFTPTRLSGQPVRVQGVVIYNFANE